MNANSNAEVRTSPSLSSPSPKSMSFRQDENPHQQKSHQQKPHKQKPQLLVPLDNFGPMNTVIIDGRAYGVYESTQLISPSSSSSATSSQSSSSLDGIQSPSSMDGISLQQVVLKPPSPHLSTNGVVKRSSSGMGTKPMHTCSVCGDRAFYVFYGALACDSCR